MEDLVQRLLALPAQDPRLLDSRLVGSFLTGKTDQWSDIDLLIRVGVADRDAIVQRLPVYIATIQLVVAWHKTLAGETMGSTHWCVPHDVFFFLASGLALEVIVDTGLKPSVVHYGRVRPMLLSLWSTNFPRWVKAICRRHQEAVALELERVRAQVASIGLELPGESLAEVMDYVELHGPELCRSMGERYPWDVVRARRLWIDAMRGRS